MQKHADPPTWLLSAIFLPLTLMLSLGLLRPIKGGTVGLMLMLQHAEVRRRDRRRRPTGCEPASCWTARPRRSLPPVIEADRAQAVADLAAENHFAPLGREGRIARRALRAASVDPGRPAGVRHPARATAPADRDRPGARARSAGWSRTTSCWSTATSRRCEEGREARIQAIDMGRRGLHNEGAELMTRAAGRQDRHRFRDRAAAVHPGLRAAPADLTDSGAMKIDGTPYRTVWVDRGRWLVGPHPRPDQAALGAGDPAPDRRGAGGARDPLHAGARRAADRRGRRLRAVPGAARRTRRPTAMERDAAMLAATRPTAVNLRWALDRMLTRLRNTPARRTRRRRLCRGRRDRRRGRGAERGDRPAWAAADRGSGRQGRASG